MSTLTK
jgi:hypothetical protein